MTLSKLQRVILSSLPLILGVSAQGKRGLSYGNVTWANYFAGNSKVTWGYNWGITSGGLDSSLDYVPMLWGVPSGPDPDFESAAGSAKYVLGLNEPDLTSQANTIPTVAAAGYKTYMQPLAGKTQIGAPAVTNAGNGVLAYMGLGWLDSFFADCTGCQIDFIPLHWYANDTAANFEAYLTEAHTRYNKPIWVTEFQLQDSDANQIAFLKEVLPWMDSQSWIGRYAYFGPFETFLINGAGNGLSDVGQAYVSI